MADIAKRISEIVKLLMRAKKNGARLKGNSALEKELQAIINRPVILLNCDWEPCTAQPKPIPYECEIWGECNEELAA